MQAGTKVHVTGTMPSACWALQLEKQKRRGMPGQLQLLRAQQPGCCYAMRALPAKRHVQGVQALKAQDPPTERR